MELTLAILAAFAAIGLACYEAGRDLGRDEGREAQRAARYEAAVSAGRRRHPSDRPLTGQAAVDTYLGGAR